MGKALGLLIFGILCVFFVVGACGALASLITEIIGPNMLQMIIVLPIFISALALGAFSIAYVRRAIIHAKLMYADKNGVYPVLMDNDPINTSIFPVAMAYHDSNKVTVPQSLQYAPRMSVTGGSDIETPIEALALNIPPFSSLPFVSDQILIGYENNDPFYAQTNKLISTLVGGQSGTGKSTLMRLMVAQYIRQGYKLSLIDPHLESGEESLASSFVGISDNFYSPIVSRETPSTIHDTLNLFDTEIINRLAGKTTDRTPLILIIDEFTGLLAEDQYKKHLLSTVSKIATESRKVKIICFCLAQQFRKEHLPVSLRNSFSNIISTKTRRDTAFLLSGSNEFANEVEKIKGYQSVFMDLSSIHRLDTPNCTRGDILTTRVINASLSPTIPTTTNQSSLSKVVGNDPNSSGQRRKAAAIDIPDIYKVVPDNTLTAKEKLIISKFKLGDSISDIAVDVFNLKTKGGDSYMKAVTEIQNVLRGEIR